MQTLFLMLLFDFLYAKPFLINNVRKKPKKQNTGQVTTLKEGNWFQIKSKPSPLQSDLCMIARGSGQNSKTEGLGTGLDICLCRAKPEAQGSQNIPLQSQVVVQSLTSSRVYSSGQQKYNMSVYLYSLCVTVALQKPHLHCFKLRKEVIRINVSFKSILLVFFIWKCNAYMHICNICLHRDPLLDSHNLPQLFHWKLKYYNIIII